MFPLTVDGEVALAAATLRLLPWMLGWRGILLAVIGLVAALRTRRTRVLWLLLPLLSYYVSFIAVVGYVYDRFLLPVTLILAVFAGGAVREMLRCGDRHWHAWVWASR